MRRVVPCLFALTLLLVACSPATVIIDDNLLRDDSLISGDPCAAPCFRGITPGVTAWLDALTILEDDTEFDNVQKQGPAEGETVIQASWQHGPSAPGCCQIVTEDGETVSLIFLRTAPNHTLGEAIEKYGEPNWMIGQAYTDDQAVVSLLYPDVPMVIYVFVAGEAEGVLSAGSEVVGALYLTPDSFDLLVKTSELHKWDGYGSYSDYMDGEWEVTPSVTLTPTP